MTPPYIRTASGTDVFLLVPTPDVIHIRDIAHHLAQINRFTGATRLPYSVAQHSVLVADLLLARKQPAPVCLWGLLHDAHEAYLGDVTSPVKRLLGMDVFDRNAAPPPLLDEAAGRFDLAIAMRFHLAPTPVELREVHMADLTAFATEWRDLMPGPCPLATAPSPHPVKPMNWSRAEDMFLKTFNTLARHCGVPEA